MSAHSTIKMYNSQLRMGNVSPKRIFVTRDKDDFIYKLKYAYTALLKNSVLNVPLLFCDYSNMLPLNFKLLYIHQIFSADFDITYNGRAISNLAKFNKYPKTKVAIPFMKQKLS